MLDKVWDYVLGKDDRYTKRVIHNVRGLYEVCCTQGKNEAYEGVSIGDILVDAENVREYANGIEGCRIVETAFLKKAERESAVIMKCPSGEKEELQIKIIFADKKSFLRQYDRLTDVSRTTPIIIAGEWETTPNETEYQSQCIIHRAKQIYYVNG